MNPASRKRVAGTGPTTVGEEPIPEASKPPDEEELMEVEREIFEQIGVGPTAAATGPVEAREDANRYHPTIGSCIMKLNCLKTITKTMILTGLGLILMVGPSLAQVSIFENGFESGSTCRWTSSQPSSGNCPPRFPGIVLSVANDVDRAMLTWLPAEDDSTGPDQIVYEVHLSQVPDFEPTPSSLVTTLQGNTQTTLTGLTSDTTYHALVVARDASNAASVERDYQTLRMPALPTILSGSPLQDVDLLNLGELIDLQPSSLTFQRTGSFSLPTVGAILVGQRGGVGFLRRVQGVTTTATTVVVQTTDASLNDAVGQIDLANSLTLLGAGQETFENAARLGRTQRTSLVEAQRLELDDGTLYSRLQWDGPLTVFEQWDYVSTNLNAMRTIDLGNIRVDVSVDFQPTIDLEVSWSLFGGIESGRAIARGTLSLLAEAEYNFSQAGSVTSGPIRLFKRSWLAYYHLGAVPVLQRIDLEVDVEATASASTRVKASASASASASAELGAVYDPAADRWNPVQGVQFNTGASADLSIKGSVQGEVRVIPKVTVVTYETIGASFSLEPSLSGDLGVENTVNPVCSPLELTNFDVNLNAECFIGVDFRIFNHQFDLLGRTRICGPLTYPLFTLPDASLGQSGSGTAADPLQLTATVTDGINNPLNASSIDWNSSPDLGSFSVVSTGPPQADFVCNDSGQTTLTFSGHGRLGELGRRCYSVDFFCDNSECMTGTWQDNYSYIWLLTQEGSVVSGTVTEYGLTWGVTGSFDGTNVTLTARLGTVIPGYCDFTYNGTISDCQTGSGTWVQIGGDVGCTGSGTWSMSKLSRFEDASSEPPSENSPGRVSQ